MSCCDIFSTFSIFVVGFQLLFGVVRYLYENFYGPWFGEPVNFRSYGKWALVTGATDGIGKEYATQLAQKGVNIILVSRTLSKLEAVAKEIRESCNVETAVIDVDFTSVDIYDKIKDRVKGKEIGILVNNVGMSYSTPDFFLAIPEREKFIKDLINCNITSMPMMCSIVLPQMVQRKRGIIINIGSVSSTIPSPNLCIYSGSKAFVDKFSVDLSAEYEKSGIIVQSVLPGPVATKMPRIESGILVPSPENYVKAALATVGFAGHTNVVVLHMILQNLIKIINFLSPSLIRYTTTFGMAYNRRDHIKRGWYKPVDHHHHQAKVGPT